MARRREYVWKTRDERPPPPARVLAVLTAQEAGVTDLEPLGGQVEVVTVGREKWLRYRLRPEDVAARYGPPGRRRQEGHG